MTEYLDLAQSSGLTTYVLEYADNTDIAEKTKKYAAEHNYICYVASDIELN